MSYLFTAVPSILKAHPLFFPPLLKKSVLSLHCLKNTVQMSRTLHELLLTYALARRGTQLCYCLLHSR